MLPDPQRLVTCNRCGWVHVAVTREYAEHAVASFNDYFRAQSPDVQLSFRGISSLEKDYMRCHRCGGPHTEFHVSEPGDCPRGCTISPILQESKTEPDMHG